MIKKIIEAAFVPAGRAASADDAARFAILPQQTEDELLISEVHTKLDNVLCFLQRDVGYTLLQDARPRQGGGVRLECRPPTMPAVKPKSAKMPKAAPEVVDKDRPVDEEVLVDGQPGMREVIRFRPDTAKYAHFPDDLVLVYRFAEMLGESCPDALPKVRNDQLYKSVLQGVRLMHLCEYNYSDVVVTLAYASIYFRAIFENIGNKMSEYEVAHVCVLLIYLAHSFLLDETCPLRCWQKYVFRKYCTLKVLDAALFRLFSMREDYGLRVTPEEEKYALSVLLCSDKEYDVTISLSDKLAPMTCEGGPRHASPSPSNGRKSPSASSGVSSVAASPHSAKASIAGSPVSPPDEAKPGRANRQLRPPVRPPVTSHVQDRSLNGRSQVDREAAGAPAVRLMVPA